MLCVGCVRARSGHPFNWCHCQTTLLSPETNGIVVTSSERERLKIGAPSRGGQMRQVFSEQWTKRRSCLAQNGWKQWKMNVAAGKGRKEQGTGRGKEGSEKAAAVRVERFALFPSSPFFPFCTLAWPGGRGKIPPSQTVPELLNSASPFVRVFELHFRSTTYRAQ